MLLALQAPVARDLRLVISAIQAAEKIERMGNLARHVAEHTLRRHPACAVPPDLAARFGDMARLAVAIGAARAGHLAAPVEEHFTEQDAADDRIDELHREILHAVDGGASGRSVREAVDVALLARFVERFADQAVSITRRLDYIVTGVAPGRGCR